MTARRRRHPEAVRLEQLWGGEFGDSYTDRNEAAGSQRSSFWWRVLEELRPQEVLEVGCNVGANLQWIAASALPHKAYGVDINLKALSLLRQRVPKVNAVRCRARDLPFRDSQFDLVFSTGVLIHQSESVLPLVMAEIVRVARRHILCGEYYAERATEVMYRGQSGALFKRDYGGLYQELFPDLVLLRKWMLGRNEGWDDVTFWVLEKDAKASG